MRFLLRVFPALLGAFFPHVTLYLEGFLLFEVCFSLPRFSLSRDSLWGMFLSPHVSSSHDFFESRVFGRLPRLCGFCSGFFLPFWERSFLT